MKKVTFTAGALRLVGAAGCFGLIGCCNGNSTVIA
jgi:lipoprotein